MAVIALNFRFINKISILLLEVKVLMIFMAVMSDGIEVKVDSRTEDAEEILFLLVEVKVLIVFMSWPLCPMALKLKLIARLKMPKRLFYL